MPTLAFTDARSDRSNVSRFRPAVALVQLNDDLWRVTRPGGEVLGYVERFDMHATSRFRAKRMIAVARRFVSVGEFWTIDEAVDCFG